MYKKQVDKSHYNFRSYVPLDRWQSFYHQIEEVYNLSESINKPPLKVLEIGIGNGITKAILRQLGFEIKTMDIDPDLNPDFIGALPSLDSVGTERFDCIICFEVLEHIKFEDVKTALRNMAKIALSLIISVPNQGKHLHHEFNGEHYWELESKETSTEMFEDLIKNAGWKIKKTYLVPENTYHRFYTLEK